MLAAKCIGASWTWEEDNNGGPLNAITETQFRLHKKSMELCGFFKCWFVTAEMKACYDLHWFSYGGNIFWGISECYIDCFGSLCIKHLETTSWSQDSMKLVRALWVSVFDILYCVYKCIMITQVKLMKVSDYQKGLVCVFTMSISISVCFGRWCIRDLTH